MRSLHRPGLRQVLRPLEFGLGYLPALLAVVVMLASIGVGPGLAFGVAGMLLLAVFVAALRLPAH